MRHGSKGQWQATSWARLSVTTGSEIDAHRLQEPSSTASDFKDSYIMEDKPTHYSAFLENILSFKDKKKQKSPFLGYQQNGLVILTS